MNKLLFAIVTLSLLFSSVANAQSKIVAFDNGTRGNLISFEIGFPTAVTASDTNYRLACMDFDAADFLHGIDLSSQSWGTVDIATGNFASELPLPDELAEVVGMSFDASQDIFYACSETELIEIDDSTGEIVASVRPITGFYQNSFPIGPICDIAISNDGIVYCLDKSLNALWTIDKETGNATWLAFSPTELPDFSSMDFHPPSNTLYQFVVDQSGEAVYGSWNLDGDPLFQELTTPQSFPGVPVLNIAIRDFDLLPGATVFAETDSWGLNVFNEGDYLSQINETDYHIIRNAISGRRLVQMANTFSQNIQNTPSDAVIVQGGVNDIAQSHTFEEIQSAYLSMIEQMPPGRPLIIFTIGPVGGSPAVNPDEVMVLLNVNDWLRSIDFPNVFVLDIVPVVDPDGDNELDNGNPDGGHLNALGHSLLADAVLEFMSDQSLFGQIYGHNQASAGSFETYPIHSPEGLKSINRNYQTFAIDFNDTTEELWCFDVVSNSLGVVDLDSGSFSSELELSGDIPASAVPKGLSYDVVGDCFFLSTASELYRVDRMGITTFIGSFVTTCGTSIDQMSDISVNTAGEIFGFEIETDSLFFIDKNTGICSSRGVYDLGDAISDQSIDFDPANNLLYAAISTGSGTGSYGTWDVDSGQFTEIVRIQDFPDQVGKGYNLEIAILDQFEISTPPESATVFRGIQISGELDSYAISDNDRAVFQPGFTIAPSEAPIWLIFESTNAQTVTSFLLESHANTPGLEFVLEAWNWNSNSYEPIGTGTESFGSDDVFVFPIDEKNHVSLGGNVRSRVGWSRTGFTVTFPWQVKIDQAGWTE